MKPAISKDDDVEELMKEKEKELREFLLDWLREQEIEKINLTDVLHQINVAVTVDGSAHKPGENSSDSFNKRMYKEFKKFILEANLEDVCILVENLHLVNFLKNTHRKKLPHINELNDVLDLLRNSKKVMILTGAGLSVSCGISDFRSTGGIYETIAKKYNLEDPQELFSIEHFNQDPKPFYSFCQELYPSPQHKPSPSHYFIKLLEQQGKLLRNYTQNIDTLEQKAEIKNVVHCHGSFATASCVVCSHKVDGREIRDDIMAERIPMCKHCNASKAFMKPDIVFFGEALPKEFDSSLAYDAEEVDLLIVMGSSLCVSPVALIPDIIAKKNPKVPQLLINRELVGEPHEFDIHLKGDCDDHIIGLCISCCLDS
eukprot:CAMPEP_0174258580 /NCGR_PEP_ID=MMETSP0439-20130205/7550_1 /TAXON_ID=0 /ORGANISM="Stereomyxa ramosa, Strain Chinc5" /LENGTH=371 /DNA_ID=CAMNT_0015342137 /DNA_START=34 /DNA_END=1146 /DNA_ORIENTATION=-